MKAQGTKSATHKLKCTVSGNWQYVGEDRFMELAKAAGSQKKLIETYVSREGKKIMEEHNGKLPKDYCPKNKIRCIISNELCFISDERLKKLTKQHGSEQAVRDQYTSRVAKHLMAAGKTKTEIRAMAEAGELPEPTGGALSKFKIQGPVKVQGAKKVQGKAKQGAKAQGAKAAFKQGVIVERKAAAKAAVDHVSDTVPKDLADAPAPAAVVTA